MRRTLHVILSLTLVLATTGLSISKHYCGSLLIGTNLGTKATSCAMEMDMDMDGCCEEKTETLILDDDFQVSNLQIDLIPEYDLLIAYRFIDLVAANFESYSQNLTPSNTGPPVSAEPVYCQVQSFLL